MKSAKPQPISNFVTHELDLIVDGIRFKREQYMKLIPSIYDALLNPISPIFMDEKWKSFLTEEIEINNFYKLYICIRSGNILKDLRIYPFADTEYRRK